MKILCTGLLIFAIHQMVYSQVNNHGENGFNGLSKEQKEELLKEKIIVGFSDVASGKGKNKMIEAVIIFDKTIENTWKLLAETENQPLYIDGCKKIVVVSKKPDQSVEVHTSGNWFINLEYGVIEYFDQLNYKLSWTLDKSHSGNSLDEMKGYWQLFPYGKNQAIGRYGNSVSLRNVPDFVENMFKKNGVKSAMESIKKYIDSGGTYRK